MKQELNTQLFQKLERARYLNRELDCWRGRVLQKVLGYREWRNFLKVIQKAKVLCNDAGFPVQDHFAGASTRIQVGKGGSRKVEDVVLTRYACYLITQNVDPAKNETAFARTYFATQTRTLEVIEQRLLDIERLSTLSKSENRLSSIIYKQGTDQKGFDLIRSWGDKALFGGQSTKDMKKKLAIPEGRMLADFLSTLPIMAKDLAAELTRHNILEKELVGEYQISMEYIENSQAVRNMLIRRGVKPEALPAGEDITKVRDKLDTKKRISLKGFKVNG